MRRIVTDEEFMRREAMCAAAIEAARVSWKHNNTKENRDSYYAAVRHDWAQYLACYDLTK